MKRRWFALGVLWAAAAVSAAPAEVERKATIEKRFTLAASTPRRVKVDNLDGALEVTGYNGRDVELVVERTVRAEAEDRLEAAERDVKLELSQDANEVLVYVNAPWRCNDGVNYRGWRFYGYRVRHDMRLRVPNDAELYLRTVNQGDLTVRDTRGNFDVGNVNGAVSLTDVGGAGRVHTVNGGVKVLFHENPTAACSFKTINGNIEVYFRRGLAADVRVKTFNGGVYTDFEVSSLPPRPVTAERREGRFTFRADRSAGFRIGAGGPELQFDTLNGNIRILERTQP